MAEERGLPQGGGHVRTCDLHLKAVARFHIFTHRPTEHRLTSLKTKQHNNYKCDVTMKQLDDVTAHHACVNGWLGVQQVSAAVCESTSLQRTAESVDDCDVNLGLTRCQLQRHFRLVGRVT